jgi:hypothetical protein
VLVLRTIVTGGHTGGFVKLPYFAAEVWKLKVDLHIWLAPKREGQFFNNLQNTSSYFAYLDDVDVKMLKLHAR